MGDADYVTIGTASGQNGFGPDNDLGVIKYYTDGTTIYIGITGELTNEDNLVLFFNFSGYGGRGAGNQLDPEGGFEGFVGVFDEDPTDSGLDDARMDMDVDFALAFDERSGSSEFDVDAVRYGSSDMISNANLGTGTSQSGVSSTFDAGSTFAGTGNITIAYHNGFSTDTDKGFEFSIPIAAFAGVNNTQTLQLFAIITNNEGFMSNECIPGDLGGSNPGKDANLNDGITYADDYFTTAKSLPVELAKFQATPQQNTIALNWQTTTELNNDYFSVEQASNGSDFRSIGEVVGAGTTTEVQNYTFIDENPSAGMNYYRLKQVDFNGNFEYSGILAVEYSKQQSVNFFPNPVRDELSINTNANNTTISIYNLQGQLIRQLSNITIEGQYNLNMTDLHAGLYQIQITDSETGNLIAQQRVVKQ
jgi:hypothetical protein